MEDDKVFADIPIDGYSLVQVPEEKIKLYGFDPATFPSDDDRCNVQPESIVKLDFLFQDLKTLELSREGIWVEHIGLKRSESGPYFVGAAQRDSNCGTIKTGDIINYHPFHIIEIEKNKYGI